MYEYSVKATKVYHYTVTQIEENISQNNQFTTIINLLASEFYVLILAHPVCKMLITQEPKQLTLRNKRHFEEKNGEYAASLKYSVLIFVKNIYIKCNVWRVAVRRSYI
jgi:hypothetical protein